MLVCVPKLLCDPNGKISKGVYCTAIANDYNWKGYIPVQAVNQGHFSAE